MFRKLADLAFHRPRVVLTVTVVVALLGGVLGGPVAGLLENRDGDFQDPSAESVTTGDRIESAARTESEPAVIALVSGGGRETGGRVTARAREIARDLEREPIVADVRSVPSRDGEQIAVLATFRAEGYDEDAALERIEAQLAAEPDVKVGGPQIAQRAIGDSVSGDIARAELLAFPLLFLLSLWVFRGVVAALLPLLVGGVAIVTTFLVMRGIDASLVSLSPFALNLVTGLGLGLAIDYSLFIVSRYREEIARRGAGRDALRATLATAGRTVAFSALTVAAALGALLVFPLRFLYSMGIGGVVVTLLAAIVALVALPALLAVLGERVNALALPGWKRSTATASQDPTSGGWYRLSRAVMRRPGTIAVASAVVLIVLGLPFLGINFTTADSSSLGADSPVRQVDETLRADFPDLATRSLTVVAEAPRSNAGEVRAYARELGALPGVAAIDRPRPLGADAWTIRLVPSGPAADDATQDLVTDVRAAAAPFPTAVDGAGARFADQQDALLDHLPIALLIVVATTLLILFALTGSVLLPIKAVIMNLLTLSAALGLLVLIFQDGRLEGLLDYTSQGALEATQPVLLAAIAFGLSTDYGVFLLTRIKEARDAGAGEREAVALGLQRTGRIVTAAALLFVVAIGAFATSSIVFIKLLGVGTALAVLIDASIVRALLVPSLMALMGRWNWWAPRPLRRLHERFGLREGDGPGAPGPAGAGAG